MAISERKDKLLFDIMPFVRLYLKCVNYLSFMAIFVFS
jgi:hypothetical protein